MIKDKNKLTQSEINKHKIITALMIIFTIILPGIIIFASSKSLWLSIVSMLLFWVAFLLS